MRPGFTGYTSQSLPISAAKSGSSTAGKRGSSEALAEPVTPEPAVLPTWARHWSYWAKPIVPFVDSKALILKVRVICNCGDYTHSCRSANYLKHNPEFAAMSHLKWLRTLSNCDGRWPVAHDLGQDKRRTNVLVNVCIFETAELDLADPGASGIRSVSLSADPADMQHNDLTIDLLVKGR